MQPLPNVLYEVSALFKDTPICKLIDDPTDLQRQVLLDIEQDARNYCESQGMEDLNVVTMFHFDGRNTHATAVVKAKSVEPFRSQYEHE